MQDQIKNRFESLISQGDKLIQKLPPYEGGYDFWVENRFISEYHSWLSSVSNLLFVVAMEGSYYFDECNRLMTHKDMKDGIPTGIVTKMYGLLSSAYDEWNHGLLRKIEYVIQAATFDDFLDYAAMYHKGNKKIESSVLASAVLEDTLKKISAKNNLSTSSLSLETIIDNLVKANVLTLVKGKRIKSYSGVRNHALHAEWEKFDIKDVGELINGLRNLIDDYL